ncbi:MAG: hypothetical protein IKK10_03835 [Clostridia bacterium]|nr:hypothetical protein [Clostridia bacterium]
MKHTLRTKTRKTTRVMALIIAMITALSAMSAFTLTASAANDEIEYKCTFEIWDNTDNMVYVKVNGTEGSTDWHKADRLGYSTSHTHTIYFTDKNVGKIESVTVKTEMDGCYFDGVVNEFLYFDEWTPVSITVNGVKIYCAQKIKNLDEYTFYVTDNVYKVTIKTADVKNAGTDLNVNVTLNGTNGESSNTVNTSKDSRIVLPCADPFNHYERGGTSVTMIYAPFDKLESINITLDGVMVAAKGWKCESITIEQLQGGTDEGVKTINVNQWFATEDDNKSRTFIIPLDKDENGNYMVENYDDLCLMSAMVNSGKDEYVNGNYILTNDIDCKGENFKHREMIGTKNVQFNGTFDGQGYTISNLNFDADIEGNDSGKVQGLFGSIGNNGTVKNLTVDNATVWSDNSELSGSAVISKHNNGTIENVTVKNSKVQLGDSEYLGGITGLNNGTVKNCRVENTTLMRRWGGCNNRGMGNICETNNGTVQNCSVSGCRFKNGSVSDSTLLILNGNQPV